MRRILAALLSPLTAGAAFAADPIAIEPGPEGEDTAVYRFLPNLARGDNASLYAFTFADGPQNHDFRTFLRFDLPPGLDGICLEKAEVFVFYGFDFTTFGAGQNVPGTLQCAGVLAGWSEATMTWNNQPPIGAATGTITGIGDFQFLACDVTPLVQSWIEGAPNHGIALTSPTGRVMGFYSFEAQVDPLLRPALVITPADDPLACPEPAAGAAAALVALGSLRSRRRR